MVQTNSKYYIRCQDHLKPLDELICSVCKAREEEAKRRAKEKEEAED